MRPSDGVQRGSVLDMPTRTRAIRSRPASAAVAEAKRLDREEAPTLTTIPMLPISYGDAQPLLAALRRAGGPGVVARRAARSPTTWARARRRCT